MKFVLSLLVLFPVITHCYSAVVQGNAYLENAADHSGIEIRFTAKSPSAVTVSLFNNALGFFSGTVTAGVYDIEYIQAGYATAVLPNQFISTDITLNDNTLSSMAVVNVSGNVEGTWVNNTIYNVTGDITVPAGKSLTIQAGSIIRFDGFYRFYVNGKVVALGNEQHKILFTSNKITKVRGDWAGILTQGTSADTSRFVHCVIEYGASENQQTALVYNAGNSSVIISKSTIRGSSHYGVVNTNNGYLMIDSTEIFDCYYSGITSGTSAKQSVILHNKIHDTGFMGISNAFTPSMIKFNEISNTNYGIQTWGSPFIENNIIYNNNYGIFVVGEKPLIKNNTLLNNHYGIGFYDSEFWHPSAIITSNIIYGSSNYAIYAEGIYGPEKVEYNVFYGNSGIANKSVPIGLGQVITTNVNNTPADTYLNTFSNPLFLSSTSSSPDFAKLNAASPAIHAGDPQYHSCDNSTIDCGAIVRIICSQQITFTGISNKTFEDLPFDLSASSSSGLPVTYKSDNATIATMNGNTLTIHGAGTAMITATQKGNEEFTPATPVSQQLTVHKKNQIITFNAIADKTVGSSDFPLTATSTSNQPIIYTSSNLDVATVSQNVITIKGVGTSTITASQAGTGNFIEAPQVSQQLTVIKKNQTITFASLPDKIFGDVAFVLSATASSGGSVTYSSSNSNIVTIVLDEVRIINSGTVSITASQSGDGQFFPAPEVTRQLVVRKKNQTLSFTTIPSKTVGDNNFTLEASSTSGLAVSFTSLSDKIRIDGNMVSPLSAGNVTITASQSGNANYEPAPSLGRTFCINPMTPTISLTGTPQEPILTSSAISGNQWFLNGTILSDKTGTTLPVSFSGLYTVTATSPDGCTSSPSDNFSVVVTSLKEDNLTKALLIYPNPAENNLIVQFGKNDPAPASIQIIDLTGRNLITVPKSFPQTNIDISLLNSGYYFLQISTEEGSFYRQFIKR